MLLDVHAWVNQLICKLWELMEFIWLSRGVYVSMEKVRCRVWIIYWASLIASVPQLQSVCVSYYSIKTAKERANHFLQELFFTFIHDYFYSSHLLRPSSSRIQLTLNIVCVHLDGSCSSANQGYIPEWPTCRYRLLSCAMRALDKSIQLLDELFIMLRGLGGSYEPH